MTTTSKTWYGVSYVNVFYGQKRTLLCAMSVFICVASENGCAMLKSIYNMGNFTCHMPNFINVVCGILICTIFNFICIIPWGFYDVYILLFSMSNSCMMCLKIHIHASIYNMDKNSTLCVNFVASSLLSCIGQIMHSCSKLCCLGRLTFQP